MIKKISTHLKVINILADWTITPARFLIPLMLVAALMNGYLFIRNPNIGGDALWFHSSFHNLMAGNGWTNDYGALVEPGYGMLSYPFYLLFGNIELSGMLVSALSYLLMIPTTYFTADFLFGKRSAMLAAWLIAFWPALLSFSYVNLSDTAFAFFTLLSFSLYIRILLDTNTLRRSALLGLTLGMAYLLRESEGLWIAGLALPSLFAFTLVDLKRLGEKGHILLAWLKAFLPVASAVLVFSVAVLFYANLIHSRTQVWAISTRLVPVVQTYQAVPVAATSTVTPPQTIPAAAATQAVASSNPAPEVDSATILAEKMLKIQNAMKNSVHLALFVQNLDDLAARLVGMNAHALAPLALLWLVSPFLSTQKLFARLWPDVRALRLGFALLLFSSPVWPLLATPDRLALRYFVSDFVYFLIPVAFLAVRFMERTLEALGSRQFDLGIMLICLVALVAALALGSPNLAETLTARHAHLGLRAGGLWLHDNLSDPDTVTIIAPRKGQVALFYASQNQFSAQYRDILPTQTLEDIAGLVNGGDFEYLLLDNYYTHQLPNLEPLWNDPALAQVYGLSLLHRDSDDLFQIYSSQTAP